MLTHSSTLIKCPCISVEEAVTPILLAQSVSRQVMFFECFPNENIFRKKFVFTELNEIEVSPDKQRVVLVTDHQPCVNNSRKHALYFVTI